MILIFYDFTYLDFSTLVTGFSEVVSPSTPKSRGSRSYRKAAGKFNKMWHINERIGLVMQISVQWYISFQDKVSISHDTTIL